MSREISVVTPAKWKASHFFWAPKGKRAWGIVAAYCPSFFGLAVEVIGPETVGLAIVVGPFWLGVATIKADPA
jgi:hypothetical protein